MIPSRATRLIGVPRSLGKQSGTQEWLPQEGPWNIGRLWPGAWISGPRFGNFGSQRTGQTSKDKRTLGKRSPVEGQGSSSEGVVGWKATPELVSQDRERVSQAFGQKRTRLRTPADPSLGAVGAGSNAGPHFFWRSSAAPRARRPTARMRACRWADSTSLRICTRAAKRCSRRADRRIDPIICDLNKP